MRLSGIIGKSLAEESKKNPSYLNMILNDSYLIQIEV